MTTQMKDWREESVTDLDRRIAAGEKILTEMRADVRSQEKAVETLKATRGEMSKGTRFAPRPRTNAKAATTPKRKRKYTRRVDPGAKRTPLDPAKVEEAASEAAQLAAVA